MLQISDLASRTYAASEASRRQTCLTFPTGVTIKYAPVAELADALDLGSSVPDVKVQVLSGAPNSRNPNLVPVGEGFGFLLYLDYTNLNSKLEKQ